MELIVKGLTISKSEDIERVFTSAGQNEDGDSITTCGHRIGWDWNSNLGTVVWSPSGRRVMHSTSIK
jgi:hypothetical protein